MRQTFTAGSRTTCWNSWGGADLRRQIGSYFNESGWELHKYGILKTRISRESPGVREPIGDLLLFPYVDLMADDSLQIRVPLDDTHTLFIWYNTFGAEGRAELRIKEQPPQDPRRVPVYEVPMPKMDEAGGVPWEMLDNNGGQDLAMWHSQGDIVDRTKEHLGRGDAGVILYRKLLEDQIKVVEDGGDPINTFRDREANQSIDTTVEKAGGLWFFARLKDGQVNRTHAARKYSPIYREATRQIEGEEAVSRPIY